MIPNISMDTLSLDLWTYFSSFLSPTQLYQINRASHTHHDIIWQRIIKKLFFFQPRFIPIQDLQTFFSQAPLLQTVSFGDSCDSLAPLLSAPSIRSLSICGPAKDFTVLGNLNLKKLTVAGDLNGVLEQLEKMKNLTSLKLIRGSGDQAFIHKFNWAQLSTLKLKWFKTTDFSFIQSCTNLTNLSLFCGCDLPAIFGTLTNLKSLRVSGQELRDPQLSSLTRLEKLELYSLTDPFFLGFERLTMLLLCDLRSDSVSFIGKMTNLQSLRLDKQQWDHSFLGDMTNLTDLDINCGESFDVGIIQGLTKLNQLYMYGSITNLEALSALGNLENFSMTDYESSFRALNSFSLATKLKKLNLGSSNLANRSFLEIAHLTNLVELCLQSSRLSDSAMETIAGFINLEYLNLYENQITNTGLEAICGKLTKLQTLFLGANPTTLDGFRFLSEFRQLSTFSFDFQDRISSIFPTLANLTNVEALRLNSYTFFDEDLQYLTRHTKLKTLHLSRFITENGLKHLEGLRIETLGLPGVSFASEAMQASLRKLTRLMSLNVGNQEPTAQMKEFYGKVLPGVVITFSRMRDC